MYLIPFQTKSQLYEKSALFFLLLALCIDGFAQKIEKISKEQFLEQLSNNACKCIDSIKVNKKANKEVMDKINNCINKQTSAYQLAAKLLAVQDATDDTKNKKKTTEITVNINENSDEFKTYYYEMERYLKDHCPSMNKIIATNDETSEHSISQNPKAIEYYNKGLNEIEKGNNEQAAYFFEKATSTDARFAFAWDNLGLSYRRLGKYDKAIEAYKKSLDIDPRGTFPLQNIAVAYEFNKDYEHAIEYYQKLSELSPNNPETFFGMGKIYAFNLNDSEKGLDYLCKAYNLYAAQKSPYRTDAETLINLIYNDMSKAGKEATFKAILKRNHIVTE